MLSALTTKINYYVNFWKIFEVEKYTQILEASLLLVEGHAVFSILAIMHGNMQILKSLRLEIK